MQPLLIDTHAHIYLPAFAGDIEKVIDEAVASGVKAIFLPAIDAETHAAMLQLAEAYPICYPMMGLHPCSVKENLNEELALVERLLDAHRFIAIGEIGLDFYWDKTFTAQQYAAFHRQIELALARQLPVVIHSRDAVDECIDVVAQYPDLRGVFHCFSGTAAQAEKIISLNFLLGIGGVATFKNGGLDQVLPHIGLSSVVLETDAPYLAPVPYRGKRNTPAYTKLVAEKLAAILGLPVEQVATVTTQNAEKLFSFRENH